MLVVMSIVGVWMKTWFVFIILTSFYYI